MPHYDTWGTLIIHPLPCASFTNHPTPYYVDSTMSNINYNLNNSVYNVPTDNITPTQCDDGTIIDSGNNSDTYNPPPPSPPDTYIGKYS